MENEVRFLYLDDIIPNRFQPRENFDEQALKELAVSIKEHGVIQPIVVRQIGDKYEIIAGERRYKASTMAGLTKIPAIIKNLDDKESSKVALIENLQRKDLTAIEEARTYQKILELDALTQEELARTMGKSQSAVSNKLRLLSLTDEVQDALLHEQISERHARSLLNVGDKVQQVELLKKVINSRMTVRELELEIKQLNGEILPKNNDSSIGNTEEKTEKIETLITDQNEDEVIGLDSSEENIINKQPRDVIEEKPKSYDIDNLLNPNLNNMSVEESNSQAVEELDSLSNKEEVIGGSGLLAGMSVDTSLVQPKKEDSVSGQSKPDISASLYENFNERTKDNSPAINVKNEFDLKLEKNALSADSSSSIESVKEAVNNIKSNNKNIEVEEFDFDDFYQIVIRVDKN